ncbi:Hemolysin-type calcium-binding repeat-containing protein [Paracoccus thiocyanatus]|uniref:Hemolysin-type calcium-binding repeat-containing protein n=1 Tax=Paracoccus thiocyanatus TaxID=34006 RepID=A0A1N6V1J1_9RHOB|nr:calcium-binding protein [Paracoccus thiocyanatus]SIQ71456.1 Hemolysin-type calcium-binding repeat-containing protein [Paracoccus thiocyanatus]
MAVISGAAGNDSLHGTAGRDTIAGNAGRDTLNAGRGSDSVHGGPGPDVLIWDQDPASRGNLDIYQGGNAGERYDPDPYGALSGGDRLHLNGGGGFRVTFTTTEHGHAQDAFGNRLNFWGIERLQTGAGNDWISAQGARLNAARGSGADHTPVHGVTINSGGGHDYLHGGPGNDVLEGGNGNDSIYGGNGNDLLMPSQGNDFGHAGAGDDNVRWGNNGGMAPIHNIGRDTLVGGAGNDLLNVWAKGDGENSTGAHVVFTGRGAGHASYAPGNGTLTFREFELFWTHEGRDTVTAANAAIGLNAPGLHINTRWGDDRITGSAGRDTIEGGEGADTINGGRGNDFISMTEDVYAANGALAARDTARDVLILNDGFGTDTIRAFQVGDMRDAGGVLRLGDRLNVSGLHDAQGNRVDLGDVRVSAQGANAVLSFPNGERLILEGVDAAVLTRAMLHQMGIPQPAAQEGRAAAPALRAAQAEPDAAPQAAALAADADPGLAKAQADAAQVAADDPGASDTGWFAAGPADAADWNPGALLDLYRQQLPQDGQTALEALAQADGLHFDWG